MQTAARRLARLAKLHGRPERVSYGPIELEVTNVERAVAFWTSALGMTPRPSKDGVALGTRSQTLLVLHGGARESAQQRRYSGLYHVAIGVPDQVEFSRLLARLIGNRISVSADDHVMSKALYFHDPDGIGIVIAHETPTRFSHFGDFARGVELFDTEGRPHPGRAPLNVAEELDHARNADLDADLAEGTRIAYLNLSVPDLAAAVAFYERLGFVRNLMVPHIGFADLGAGSTYTHRIGFNTWLGPDSPPAPKGSARLRRFHLHLAEQEVFTAASHLPDAADDVDGRLRFIDPGGIEVILSPPSQS
ncbi:VOC family protein [Pleomorphomonas oryzae]|uniref:VOC family protein n=1 Tax=Pleomorphomonas oryzae TaxID=261934 RepID=UPI00040D44D9|nr:VOC family protein [Pleomorphomonas oryzae]